MLTNVAPLITREKELLEKQIADGIFDENVFLYNYDVEKLKYEGRGIDVWEKLFGKPQLNIDGIYSGYTGPETKTLLPHIATAKVDVRMVPEMEPDEIVASIRKHLDHNGFSDIEVKVYNKYPWSKVSMDEKVVQSMIKTYREMGKEPQIWPI